MTLDEKLIKEINNIAALSSGLNRYGDANVHEKGSILNEAAFAVGGEEDYKTALENMEKGDAAYGLRASQGLGSKVNKIKSDYEANKDAIVNEVERNLNSILREAKNSVEASQILANILKALMKLPLPSQAKANEIKADELSRKLGIVITEADGDPEEVREIMYRVRAADYLAEEKDKENKVTYKIDIKKLKPLMDNPVSGSVLYSLTKEE